jgi:hypothetical protein
MKKMLLLLVSALLVASLLHGTYSTSTAHADCATLLHDTRKLGDNSAEHALTTGSRIDAGIATATTETAQQIEEQGVSFPDRVLNLIDTFAKLVMVI